ncbi:MAG: DUF1800 family protein [Saprospiraceae bacterium]|nr:DUF1800 family protein [Saprospiraceae bacterium]
MMKNLITAVFTLSLSGAIAQPYNDYIGAGHTGNINVTASSTYLESSPLKTINGSGLDGAYFDASRFMVQATLGGDSSTVVGIMGQGYDAWISDQFTKTPTYILPVMEAIWDTSFNARVAAGQDPEDIFGPYALHFNYAWWQVNVTNHFPNQNKDLLRQRVAMALSEIFVISANSDLGSWGDAMASYYDLLIQHSFGNYRDLLREVSVSFPMGYYLSHLNNPKTNLEENIRPDENYAREIMQLFSIGLFKLNPDGTQQLDGNGFPIPTYDNNDIKEMAKSFTGLHGGAVMPCPPPPNCPPWWPMMPQFGLDPYFLIKTAPMIMANSQHEPGPKTMPDGITVINIPNNGMAEIDAAIDFLFNHSNTPPFISYRLIQRLVKSNPSPAYIQRVAAKFINNGSGVRGDMKAVIRAILMDDEARKGNYLTDASNGMLLAPTLRYTQFCKANTLDSDLGRFWNNGYGFREDTGHHPLMSPTVFNFYTPDYAPIGPVTDAGLKGPEFKIHNSNTSINYINTVNSWLSPWPNSQGESGYVMYSWEGYNGVELDSTVHLETAKWEAISTDKERLIHELDKAFTHGQLSDGTKNILRNVFDTIDTNTQNSSYWATERMRHKVRFLLYFILISPDFNILK